VRRKNCDKLFAYTSVFAAVTESSAVPACNNGSRLAGALARLQMVLMGRFCKFQKQNRELPYASQGASRVKYKLNYCPDGTNLLSR
jgi:hypothetical protein